MDALSKGVPLYYQIYGVDFLVGISDLLQKNLAMVLI